MLVFNVSGNVRNYFFNRKLLRNAKDISRTVQLKSFASVKYIGFIVGSSLLEKDSKSLQQLITLLNNHKKSYYFIVIAEKRTVSGFPPEVPHTIISRKDLTFSGVPSEKALQEVRKHRFDLLIDLNRQPKKAAFFIETIADASLRIGKADPERYPYVDLMIEWRDSDDAFQFVEYIIYYLSMLTEKPKI